MKPRAGSRLEKVLKAGEFAVTVEVGPPRGPNAGAVVAKARILADIADGYNVTDNQTAVVRMSSIAASKILLDEGLEPVMQMVCRDRNRIAMQSDLIGASALGIRNVLCLSGDHQKASAGGKLKGHPGAKNVYDIDSIQLVSMVAGMRDRAVQEGGDPLTEPTPFWIGAAWTPLAPPTSFRVFRLAKKVQAGADFIQTQAIFDLHAFAHAMQQAVDLGITEKTFILGGIIVPKSASMLRYMQRNVPGVVVPDVLIDRMAQAKDQQQEGFAITLELIAGLREIPGVKGVHLQAIEAEHLLPEIIQAAGLLPRPSGI
ncbi:MAG: methylenetetrahydrofolate reductase [Thermodesulfobacteriota bacterium]